MQNRGLSRFRSHSAHFELKHSFDRKPASVLVELSLAQVRAAEQIQSGPTKKADEVRRLSFISRYRFDYTGVTFSAHGPFCPRPSVKDTCCPS